MLTVCTVPDLCFNVCCTWSALSHSVHTNVGAAFIRICSPILQDKKQLIINKEFAITTGNITMCYVVYVTIGQKITFKPEYIAYMANKQKQKRLTIHLFYACLRISGMIFF